MLRSGAVVPNLVNNAKMMKYMSIVPLGQQNSQANENVFLKRVEKHSSGSHESFKRFSKH